MSKRRDTLVPEPPEPELLDPTPTVRAPLETPPQTADEPLEALTTAPQPSPVQETPVEAVLPTEQAALPPDPFARARAALEAAREARGEDESEQAPLPSYTSLNTDPLGRAQAALEAARAARGQGASTSRKLVDAMAEAQLRRLKSEQDDT